MLFCVFAFTRKGRLPKRAQRTRILLFAEFVVARKGALKNSAMVIYYCLVLFSKRKGGYKKSQVDARARFLVFPLIRYGISIKKWRNYLEYC